MRPMQPACADWKKGWLTEAFRQHGPTTSASSLSAARGPRTLARGVPISTTQTFGLVLPKHLVLPSSRCRPGPATALDTGLRRYDAATRRCVTETSLSCNHPTLNLFRNAALGGLPVNADMENAVMANP